MGPGSRVAVVAPSSPFSRDEFDAGLARLADRYEVVLDENVFARAGYLAGDDDARARAIARAVEDETIDAIVCARGGYGATRLLERLDQAAIARANKRIVGFSDVTALHAAWARAGVRSLHASMVVGVGRGDDRLAMRWFDAVEGRGGRTVESLEPLTGGSARGPLIGGNLAVLAALVGTRFSPPLDGSVLFLEDVGERPYRIDRMLTQLGHAGWLSRVSAVIVGAFTDAAPGADGTTAGDVLRERLDSLSVPVVLGFPAGHIDDNLELPFGASVEVDASRATVTILD